MEENVKIGYTRKTYGYQGALKVFVEERFLDDFLEAKIIFLEIAGEQIPYFVRNIEDERQLLLTLEDIDSKETAKALTNKSLYLRPADLSVGPEEDLSELEMLRQFIGYTIVDPAIGEVGPIEDIIEMPQQYLAVVQYGGKEALIPLVDQFLTNADPEKMILEMDLPEGLLEVF